MNAVNSWHVRVHKLTKPYKFKHYDFGYWNAIKPTKRILKRCDCKLVNIPSTKRNLINEKAHIEMWGY